VHDWLESHGVERAKLSHSLPKDWINVQLPVSDIERLSYTQHFIYELLLADAMIKCAKHAFWAVSTASLSLGLLRSQHKHLEAAENTSYLCDRSNGVGGRVKAESNEKRGGAG